MHIIISFLMLLAIFVPALVDAAAKNIKLAYIGDIDHAAYLGAKQGLIEANLQGQFLGMQYSLVVLDSDQTSATELSDFVALLANLDDQTLTKLSARTKDLPIFNLVSESNSLRQHCTGNLFHVMPSRQMKHAAIVWGQEKYQREVEAKAWHYDFKKFAARDLNKRFKKNFKHNMTEYAWAGWAAVKITTDAVARGSGTQAAELLQYVKHKLAFDGQKGVAMNFDNTGQLRQILLLTADGELIGEAPLYNESAPVAPDCAQQTTQ